MHEPLTAAEYKAIAANIQFPTNAFIDGAFRPANSGKTFKTTNPATGETLAEIAACDASDVDFAVGKARQAFDDGRWHLQSPGRAEGRSDQLRQASGAEIAMNSPSWKASTAASPSANARLSTCRTRFIRSAGMPNSSTSSMTIPHPVGSNALTMVVREPIGVVGCVLPWNFPLLMLAWKIGPALAAGCSVIVKPAQETTLTTLRVAELAHEAGIPAGVFNVVTGGGKEVGEPIGMHMDVDMVAFTGSTPTGRRFLRYSADSNLKRGRPRMRRQEPGRRSRRCRGPRPRRRTGRQRRVLEHGRELLGHVAAHRDSQRQGRAARADRCLHARMEDGRSARSGKSHRRARQQDSLRQGRNPSSTT